jgi:hypothetical protein
MDANEVVERGVKAMAQAWFSIFFERALVKRVKRRISSSVAGILP